MAGVQVTINANLSSLRLVIFHHAENSWSVKTKGEEEWLFSDVTAPFQLVSQDGEVVTLC
jgi:hypothetical protein